MTSKNRQRQGRRPGAKARFFDGDGIAQAEAWAYLRNKGKSKVKSRSRFPTGRTSKRQATTEILSLRLRMTSINEQIRRFWLRQNDDFRGGCARMTSKNRQRQGRRPGAKARFFGGDGIAQAKAWAYLRNKGNSKDKYKSRFPSGMTSKRQATARAKARG